MSEFSLFQKIEVNGNHAHPLYQYLRQQAPEEENLDENSTLYKHLMPILQNYWKDQRLNGTSPNF